MTDNYLRNGGSIMDIKKQIVQSYEKLLKIKDGDKITVKDIVDTCGISRQTFYYHFEDLQSATEYSFHLKIEEAFKQCENTERPHEAIKIILDAMWENRSYIKRMKESKDMSRLLGTFTQMLEDMIKRLISSNAEKLSIAAKDINPLSEFYACGLAAFMLKHLEDDSFETQKYAEILEKMLAGQIKLFEI